MTSIHLLQTVIREEIVKREKALNDAHRNRTQEDSRKGTKES